MPRPAPYTRIPGYCFHSTRNRGYVRLDGRVYYLPGDYGSALSRAEYDRLIAVWTLNGRRLPVETPQATTLPSLPVASPRLSVAPASVITVAELCDPYLIFARGYYQKDGMQTTQVRNIEEAFRILMKLFADTPVAEFGPKKLALVRDAMIAKG